MKFFSYIEMYFNTAKPEPLTFLEQRRQLVVEILPQRVDDYMFFVIWSVCGLLTEMELSQDPTVTVLHDTSSCQLMM